MIFNKRSNVELYVLTNFNVWTCIWIAEKIFLSINFSYNTSSQHSWCLCLKKSVTMYIQKLYDIFANEFFGTDMV